MKNMTIVLRDDGYDRMLTPLTFAFEQARQGTNVDILFVLWAVKALTEKGLSELKVDGRHAAEESWLREKLARDGHPVEMHDYLRALKKTGNVRLFGCAMAARTFDVSREDLIPEADGIVEPSWFVNQRVVSADHCQYF